MIVEAVVVAAVIAGGGYLARTFWKRKRAASAEATQAAATEREATRGLGLGDVVLYMGDELWLAGALELDEEGFVMKVFRCPGGREATHLVQLDRDAREVMLAKDAGAAVASGALPSEMRLGNASFTMRRRGAARLVSRGERIIGTAATCRYTWFTAPGGKVLIAIDPEGGARLSLIGDQVPREMIEILPGSKESQPDPPGKS